MNLNINMNKSNAATIQRLNIFIFLSLLLLTSRHKKLLKNEDHQYSSFSIHSFGAVLSVVSIEVSFCCTSAKFVGSIVSISERSMLARS